MAIRDVQEELNLALSIKILSMVLLKEFFILVVAFTICDELMSSVKILLVFMVIFIKIVYAYIFTDYKTQILDCTDILKSHLVSLEIY
jgi:hypothetical protein